MKIAVIVGTRPEAIKLIPLYMELKKRGTDVSLILTGQHKQMVEQIMHFFSVSADIDLDLMKHNQKLAELSASLLVALNTVFENGKYDMVIVQGDTTTAMIGAMTAFYNGIKIAHVEAGLRTYNLRSPYPEEMNRQVITRLADYNFAPTERAAENLIKEGCSNVFTVGNTVIDSLLLCQNMIEQNEAYYVSRFPFVDTFKKIVLITGHRRENFSGDDKAIIHAIKELAEEYPEVLFYYPVHLSPKVQEPVYKLLSDLGNVMLDAPLPYDELVYIMKRSFLVLTDSGGIQEEAPTFGKPILVMRDTTERPEGITNGCAILAGTNKDDIKRHFTALMTDEKLYDRMAVAGNPYGDGTTSRQIADIILA